MQFFFSNLENNYQKVMKSSTENMKVDIDAIPEGQDASKKIEFLRNIKSWKNIKIEVVPKWNLHRYLVILYMHDSFLNVRNPLPLEERKIAALRFAHLKKTKEIEKELLFLDNDLILLMVKDLLIAQNNSLWIEIVSLESQIEEAICLRLAPNLNGEQSQATLKRQLTLDCKIWQGDLSSSYLKFYRDHDDIKGKLRARATTLEIIAIPTSQDV